MKLLAIWALLAILGFSVVNCKKDNVNIAVFAENPLGNRISELVQIANRILKGSKNEIGVIRQITNLSRLTSWTMVRNGIVDWTKETDAPELLIDLTDSFFPTLGLKSVSRSLKLATVSTNIIPKPSNSNDNHFSELMIYGRRSNMDGWYNLTQNEKKFLISIPTSSNILRTVMHTLQLHSRIPLSIHYNGMSTSAGIITMQVIQKRTTLNLKSIEYRKTESYGKIVSNIPSYNPNAVFIYGASGHIQQVLDLTAKTDPTLFDERRTWFGIKTEIGANITIPTSMTRGMLMVTPHLPVSESEFQETVKLTKSKNITDLFYLDVILSAIRSIGEMKREESKDNLNFRSHLTKELMKSSNFLGPYIPLTKSDGFYPNITRYSVNSQIPNGDSMNVANITINDFEKLNGGTINVTKEYMNHMPTIYLNATIVLDAPFVMRNETCFKEKKENDKSLACYYGYVIELLNKILKAKGIRIKVFVTKENVYGDAASVTHENCTGATHDLTPQNIGGNSYVSCLTQMGIGAFSTDAKKGRQLFLSAPFFHNMQKKESYAFAFARHQFVPALKISAAMQMLKKGKYLEQLEKTWFAEEKYKNCTESTH